MLFLLCSFLVPARAKADAIVVTRAMLASTIAEIFVEDDTVRVEVAIGLADIEAFRNVMPNEIYQRLGFAPEPFPDRIRRFLEHDWVVLADGKPLGGGVTGLEVRPRVNRDRITGEPLPAGDEEPEPVIFVVIKYPLRGRPATLAVRPPVTETGFSAANVGFVVYHNGIHVNDFRYLGGQETLNLDWDDPWYSEFENSNLRRQYYQPISVFLYIEPYEVRKEIVLRPRDLEQWIDLGIGRSETIPVSIQEDIKSEAAVFLAARTPVTVDGEPVEMTLDRVHFIYRTLRTSGVISPPQDLESVSATLGVIYVYPTDGLPDSATVTCDLFGGKIQQIMSNATDEAGGFPYILSPEDRVLKWQNFLKNPTVPTLVDVEAPPRRSIPATLGVLVSAAGLVALGAVAAGRVHKGARPPIGVILAAVPLIIVIVLMLPRVVTPTRMSDEGAQVVVGDLLRNIYRAFDFRDDGVIYDALARSADGEVLTDVYLQTRQSLELKNQGGARAKVQDVEVLSTEQQGLEGETGFVATCSWRVSGSVLHWGHVHRRANQYAAKFVVKAVRGVWKITDLELLEEIRIDPVTGEKLS
jgi:hypothetical protein